MKQKISNQSFKVIKTEEERQPTYGCNCTRAMGPCPLGGKCLVNYVVYKAEVVENNSTSNTYTGLSVTCSKTAIMGTDVVLRRGIQTILQLYPHISGTSKIKTKIMKYIGV